MGFNSALFRAREFEPVVVECKAEGVRERESILLLLESAGRGGFMPAFMRSRAREYSLRWRWSWEEEGGGMVRRFEGKGVGPPGRASTLSTIPLASTLRNY